MVALHPADDRHHQQCKETLQSLAEPPGSVWPVVTEAMYLLGFSRRAQDALWELLERGGVTLLSLEPRDFARIRELMKKYQDLPMDLADAALVRVAERERIRRIFTLDRRDFSLYRPEGLERFQILPEA